MGPGQPVNVNMNFDTLLPALQEMNGRLEGIAQILVSGEERQREFTRLQQKLVTLQEQFIKRSPDRQPSQVQNEAVVRYSDEILKGITSLAVASQQQVQAGPAPGSTPLEGQFEGIRQLLQDIKERLGDLATGVPASKDEYIDQQREKLVDDIYSKMEPRPESPEQAPKPTSRRPYSKMETPTPPEPSPWGTQSRTVPETPASRLSRVSPPNLPEVDPKVAGQMDTIFAEEAAYLDEKKAHFDKQEKYLDERKEHLTQKKAWYLNLG